MKGKLFIIEGLEHPNYKSDSSALVKMYLNGDFGKNVEDVNAYISSTFFAVDRYASYKTEWEDFYINGGIILADRYTSSNMIHQASKIEDKKEQQEFLDWLEDLEFGMYGLPRPTDVIFLNMPPEYSKQLMENRDNKITGNAEKDIHESNYDYLKKSYINAMDVVRAYDWPIVDCVENGKILSIEEIHEKIYTEVKKGLLKDV